MIVVAFFVASNAPVMENFVNKRHLQSVFTNEV